MGFTIKFNWVLLCNPPATLEAGKDYSFEKSGNRVFPIDTAIDLIDLDRNAVAKIRVKTFQNENERTTGTYTVSKLYEGDEKIVLSNYWKENE